MNDAHTRSIRDAISAEDFSGALELWEEYATSLQSEVERGRLTEAQISDARALVEWARQAVLAMRAHAQQRLNLLRAAQEYDDHVPAGTARLVQTSL